MRYICRWFLWLVCHISIRITQNWLPHMTEYFKSEMIEIKEKFRIMFGNKMPTRCNRGFYCRSYCLLNMFRAPLCPSSGAQEYYTAVTAYGISCCGFQVACLVWSWGLCVRFAGCCSRAHAVPLPCRAVNSHLPCRAPALLRQCRVLRESPRGSRKYPNC